LRPLVPYLLAIGALLLLVSSETWAFSSGLWLPQKQDEGTLKDLTEPQKKLLDSQSSYCTWLQTIGIGSLAALLGIRLKDWSDDRLISTLPMVACALLVNSIYSAHLVHRSIIYTLGHGIVHDIYSGRTMLALDIQFWSLLAGFALLAVWLFHRKPTALAALLPLILVAAPANAAGPGWKSCVSDWHKARGFQEPQPQTLEAEVSVVAVIAARSKIESRAAGQCSYVYQVMDELRGRSFLAGGDGSSEDVGRFAADVAPSLSNPNLSSSDVVQSLIKLFEPWNPSSGILELSSRKVGRKIAVDGRTVAYQSYSAHLATGKTHRFEVIDGVTLSLCREFDLNDGDKLAINLDDPNSDYSATRPCSSASAAKKP